MASFESGSGEIRLSREEQGHIVDVISGVSRQLGVECLEISLFGSRTDPNARGGDIDLYIRVNPSKEPSQGADTFALKQKLRIALKDALGDQKIDLIVDDAQTDLGEFVKTIAKQKVILWKKTQPKL